MSTFMAWLLSGCLWVAGVDSVLAAPAPWYHWRSRIDGRLWCAQTSPGTGWERQGPPFEGPGCQPRRKVLVVPVH